MHCIVLHPQNGDRIVTTDSVTSPYVQCMVSSRSHRAHVRAAAAFYGHRQWGRQLSLLVISPFLIGHVTHSTLLLG